MSELDARLRRWRHELHGMPEVGLQEYRTSDYVATELAAMGLDVVRGVGGTGLVATVRGAEGARAVALRADLDALPLPDGVRHACGHDGHLAMLLGAGRAGALMAAEDGFEIRVTGRGGHAARPQLVVDPIVVASQVVLGLQSIVSRNVDPADAAVVSCTEITTDGARNAIPGVAVIRGDTRSFSPEVRALLETRVREVAAGICAAHGATCEVTYTHEFAPTVNDPAATALAVEAARATVGDELVDGDVKPWTGSEDFGEFANLVPACFAVLGNGVAPEPGGSPLHSREFTFNDDVLATGAGYLVTVARTALRDRPA